MSALGAGRQLSEMKKKISEIKQQISQLGVIPEDVPGMIGSSNIMRKNDFLLTSDSLKSDLISYYDLYTQNLESLLHSVFEIQNELKQIIHDQSKMISEEKPKQKSTKKNKTK